MDYLRIPRLNLAAPANISLSTRPTISAARRPDCKHPRSPYSILAAAGHGAQHISRLRDLQTSQTAGLDANTCSTSPEWPAMDAQCQSRNGRRDADAQPDAMIAAL